MKFAEDLTIGTVTDCGTAAFERDEIIHFAGLYDPQPFHLNDEDASRSLFGHLTASGLQTAATAYYRVLDQVIAGTCYLGSPGVRLMRMHNPVFVGTRIRIVHSFVSVTMLDGWPRIALVESLIRALDDDGVLIMTQEALSWIGAQGVSPSKELMHALANSTDAAPALRPVLVPGHFDDPDAVAPPDGRFYFEDCQPGASFVSPWHDVDADELARFHANHDGKVANRSDGSAALLTAPLVNNWITMCLTTRLSVDRFYGRSEIVGGGGMSNLRWMTPVRAGDRLRVRLVVVEARRLHSRPGIGVLRTANICCNQRDEVVVSFHGVPFIRARKT